VVCWSAAENSGTKLTAHQKKPRIATAAGDWDQSWDMTKAAGA